MDTREAELVYDAGKEVVVKAVLAMAARIDSREQHVNVLDKKSLSDHRVTFRVGV
jgi:hypothetical protein